APAYWPWLQALRTHVEDVPAADAKTDLGSGAVEIAQIVPSLVDWLPARPRVGDTHPEHARFRLFDAVAQFLVRAARRSPLVVLFDDLHWADRASLLLLQFVAHELRHVPCLLVGTYREVEMQRASAASRVLGELGRVSERISLRGFSEHDVASFVLERIGQPAPAPLVTAIHRASDGNPFFVEEFVRVLAAEGRLGSADV